jgi:hypothetical protein
MEKSWALYLEWSCECGVQRLFVLVPLIHLSPSPCSPVLYCFSVNCAVGSREVQSPGRVWTAAQLRRQASGPSGLSIFSSAQSKHKKGGATIHSPHSAQPASGQHYNKYTYLSHKLKPPPASQPASPWISAPSQPSSLSDIQTCNT